MIGTAPERGTVPIFFPIRIFLVLAASAALLAPVARPALAAPAVVHFTLENGLEVVVIPPNRQMVRKDQADLVYRTEGEKFNAIVDEIKILHEKGQPALVGTISIEKSEQLSSALKR